MTRTRRAAAAPSPAAEGGDDGGAAVPGRRRWVAWLWCLAAALVIVAAGFGVVFNGDLWFHLAAGRWMLEHEALPAVDTWSYTAAGQPWHDHEWLAQVIFQGWAESFGLASLMVWKWLLLLATFLLLFRLLRRLGAPWPGAFAVLLFTLHVAMVFFEIRPHLYSLLFTVVVLQVTVLRQGSLRLLPVLFALWANLHAGVVFGLALLWALLAVDGCFPAGEPGSAARHRQLRDLAATALACLFATLANPYGTAALTYPLGLLAAGSASRQLLVEWLSPFVPRGQSAPLFPWAIGVLAIAALILFAAGGWRRRRRESCAAAVAAAVTLAMACASRRFIPLFALAASLVLALAIGEVARRMAAARGTAGAHGAAPRRDGDGAGRWWLAAVPPAAGIAVGCILLLAARPASGAFAATTRSDLLPAAALDFAAAHHLRGKLFAFYPWGGYVDWRTDGRLQVYIDPRAETLFDAATERAYSQVQNLEPGWQQVLEGSGADWVLWPRAAADNGALALQLQATGNWTRVHQDDVAVLLGHRGAP